MIVIEYVGVDMDIHDPAIDYWLEMCLGHERCSRTCNVTHLMLDVTRVVMKY
jgi:hypothetical protein